MVKRAATFWFTGLSGAGKSTLSRLLEREIRSRGLPVEVLDGDMVRKNLSEGLGFTKEDRDKNVRRIGFVCNLLSRNGVYAIASAISPYRETRRQIRLMHEETHFVEIFVNAPLHHLIERDVKGLYKRAQRGEILHFTGISDPYEAPENPEIELHTNLETQERSVERIIQWSENEGILAPRFTIKSK